MLTRRGIRAWRRSTERIPTRPRSERAKLSLQSNIADASVAGYPSAPVLPVLYPVWISASSSLLPATMNQNLHLPENPKFV